MGSMLMMLENRQKGKKAVRFMVLSIALCLGACWERNATTQHDQDAIRKIADSFMSEEFKDNPTGYSTRIHDDGDTWIVSYHAPPGETGGGAIIQIDKQTGAIVGAYKGGQ